MNLDLLPSGAVVIVKQFIKNPLDGALDNQYKLELTPDGVVIQ